MVRRSIFFALHLFEKKLFKEVIGESSIDAGDAPRSETPAVLQEVFTNHLDAGLVHTALTWTQRLQSLGSFLRPCPAILVKHPIQRSDDHADNRGRVLATRAPAIKCRQ
ncbi:MAG: hypothetical protein NVV83_22455 [Afipia sp.]|nr:hypothetical protein [Afipia sp.]